MPQMDTRLVSRFNKGEIQSPHRALGNKMRTKITLEHHKKGGGLAQCLGRRISDQGVPGSNPGRAPFIVALSTSHLLPVSYRLNPESGGRTTDMDRL